MDDSTPNLIVIAGPNAMDSNKRKDIGAIFREGVEIDKAFEAAEKEAILQHRQSGHPIPVWQNGRTVLMSPDELERHRSQPE